MHRSRAENGSAAETAPLDRSLSLEIEDGRAGGKEGRSLKRGSDKSSAEAQS